MKKISFLIIFAFFSDAKSVFMIEDVKPGDTVPIAWFDKVLFPDVKALPQSNKTFEFVSDVCKKHGCFNLKNVFLSENKNPEITYNSLLNYFIITQRTLEILSDQELEVLIAYKIEMEKTPLIVLMKFFGSFFLTEAFVLFALVYKESYEIPFADPGRKANSRIWVPLKNRYFYQNASFNFLRKFYFVIGAGCFVFYVIKLLVDNYNKCIRLAGGKEIFDRANKKIADERTRISKLPQENSQSSSCQ